MSNAVNVYLMYCSTMQMYKIGITKNDPNVRRAQVASSAGNPWGIRMSLSVVAYIRCENESVARSLENYMHEAGKYWRTDRTEWFSYVPRHIKKAFFEPRIEGFIWTYKHSFELCREEVRELDETCERKRKMIIAMRSREDAELVERVAYEQL